MTTTREPIVAEAAAGPCPDIPVAPVDRPRLLRRGSMHPAVRDAQRRLNRFHAQELLAGRPGVDDTPLVEDCIFGKHTFAAVVSFQRHVFPGRLSEHDGIIGPKTWAQLDLVSILPGPPSPLPLPVPPILPPPAPVPPVEPAPTPSPLPVPPIPELPIPPVIPEVPVPIPVPVPTPAATNLCDAIADVAEGEFRRWRTGGAVLRETDVSAAPILQEYYREGVNATVSVAELGDPDFQAAHPWSAVFVSFVMRRAGAGNRFQYARAHQAYIRAARRNRLAGDVSNPFWAFRPSEVAPRRGDLTCQTRAGSGATFDNIGDATFRATHCDVVTEVRPGQLRVIGGNVSQTVDARTVRTGPDGRVQTDGNQARFFAIVRCDGPLAGGVPQPIPTPPAPTPPGPAPTPAPVPADLDGRILRAMELLVDRYRYPVNGAAGIVGNLIAESSVQPNRIEGSDTRTPMRAPDFSGRSRDFTPDEVVNRDATRRIGPRLPGIGLAQWTTSGRRSGLFRHSVDGRVLGASILDSLDAQVDYLATELRTSFQSVDRVIRAPGVSVDAAAEEVVYRFEVPGAVLDQDRRLRPRDDPAVQAVFRTRRNLAARAHRVFRAAHPG